jgi:Xaa-Pro dipeptidase
MFAPAVYKNRRMQLKEDMQDGLILLLGNMDSPMYYQDTVYPFIQDANFLYFWGLDIPGLAGIIDLDLGAEILFGKDPTVEQVLWGGPQSALSDLQAICGVDKVMDLDSLAGLVGRAVKQGRKLHFLPQYRAENHIWLRELAGVGLYKSNDLASKELINAIVSLREIKSPEEVSEIEDAVEITRSMIMQTIGDIRPGYTEKEAAARAICAAQIKTASAFPITLTTQGYYLHDNSQKNVMKAGEVVIQDCGAESKMHYASDITRTIPVSGRFSETQRQIYNTVLSAMETAIAGIAPGVLFRDLHHQAAFITVLGLQEMGLMKGDAEEAVAQGAHALFWPTGLGHMLGLGVHDMEELGEDYVGYTDQIKRSAQFGTNRLRLAKPLKTGMVVTVEPGLYFAPGLIELWSSEKRFNQFISYDIVNQYIGLGGYRIEDDVLVTDNGYRILGKAIPKKTDQVEKMASVDQSAC